jgi:hypothetical protein
MQMPAKDTVWRKLTLKKNAHAELNNSAAVRGRLFGNHPEELALFSLLLSVWGALLFQ